MRSLAEVLAFGLLMISVIAANQIPRDGKAERTTPEPVASLPIGAFGGLPLVQASVNGHEPRWFILDSASTWSILDAQEAAAIGLDAAGGHPMTGGGDRIARIEFVDAVRMTLAGVPFGPMRLGVMPTSFRFDRPIAGLIGSPLFRQYVVGLDLDRRVLRLWPPQSFQYRGNGVSVPFVLQEEIPKIDVSIRMPGLQAVTADLYVDTGAIQSVMLNRPFVEANGFIQSPGARVLRRAGSLTGGTSYELARAAAVTLAGVQFDDVLVGFSQDRVGSGSRTNRAGTLGNSLLRNFVVIFDYARRRLIFERTPRPVVPFDYEVTGVTLESADCGASVRSVTEDSVAWTAGIRAGDCLIEIDGRPTRGLGPHDVKRFFHHDGRVIRARLRRNERVLTVTIQTLKVGR